MASNIADLDCKRIHDSLGSLRQLIPSLCSLSQSQRQQLRETYKAVYGEDLINRLQSLSSMMCLWMLSPHDRDATLAREALDQDVPDFKALLEIFVGRKSSHIVLIKQAYHKTFTRNLDQDILNLDPPHPFQKILMALSASHQAHQADMSQHISKCDARRLYETGEGGSGGGAIQESVLLEILSKRSIPQLKLTFFSYKHIYGHDYTKSLKRGNSGEFEKALTLLVKCICNPPSYYAKALYSSINGAMRDKRSLARTLVSRAEIDMDEIKRVFKEKYGKEVGDVICESIPSGEFRDFLVALVTRTTHSQAAP